MAGFVDRNMQVYLRVISVFIGVLLTAKWYRGNAPEMKTMYVVAIAAALLLGSYVEAV